jgi:LPXTG-motif cell wall-anchored protein
MSADQELAYTGASGVALAALGGVAVAAGAGLTFMKKLGAKSAPKADETSIEETE